jgi:uncharacterized membrane protein YbhN (UPF0104 family)/SAM-dependent methyltransferase
MFDQSPTTSEQRFSWRRTTLFMGKLAVAAGAVAWLYSRGLLDFAVLAEVPRSARTWLFLCGGCVSMFFAVGLLAFRLRILLLFHRFDVGIGPTTLITFIAYFFGALLPGMVGADAVRATFLCSRVAERRMDVVTLILFDRVVGLYSLLLLGSLALAGAFLGGIWQEGFAVLLLAPALVGLTTVGALFLAFVPGGRGSEWFLKIMGWRLRMFVAGTRALLRSWPVLIATVAVSLISHGFMVLSFVAVAVVITDPLPVFLHFVISPLAVTLNAVPISPGGLGLTEGAFSYLFHLAGSGNGALIGLLGRLLQYAAFAIGGAISLLLIRWRGEPFASITCDEPSLKNGMTAGGRSDSRSRTAHTLQQDLGRAYYDQNYGDYERRASAGKLAFYLSLVRKWVPDRSLLFELGVGQGRFLEVALPYYRVAGCDVNSFGVDVTARRVPAAQVVKGSYEALTGLRPLDVVVAWDVLEHLPDLDSGLQAIRDGLTPTGKLIGVVPVYDGPLGCLVRLLDKDETHVYKQGRRWWAEKIETSGFELVEIGGILRKLVAHRYYVHLTRPQFVLRSTGVAIYFVAQRSSHS